MSVKAGWKRTGLALVCLLLLLAPWGVRGEETAAAELTKTCTLSLTGTAQGQEELLVDGQLGTACTLAAGDALTIQSDEDMGTVHLRFCQLDSAFLLAARGRSGLPRLRFLRTDRIVLNVSLGTGCRQVRLLPLQREMSLCETAVFGPGPLPTEVPQPEASLQKADFLLVSTHPDDEWVYLGGVYPTYGGERGYQGAVVYMTLPSWERAQESVDGLWIGGVKTHPFFLGFPDIRKGAPRREKAVLNREDVTLALVRLYRRIRPLVVVTQDPKNGEYGHWQHKLSAGAAFDAVQLAADPAYDPESAAQYGTWTVMKLYQHFAQGISTLVLDVDTPLERYGGRTALQVANDAFMAHKTQQKTKYRPGAADRTKGDIRHFGLTWSTVGADTGADLFEHIPPEALAAREQRPSADPEAGEIGGAA